MLPLLPFCLRRRLFLGLEDASKRSVVGLNWPCTLSNFSITGEAVLAEWMSKSLSCWYTHSGWLVSRQDFIFLCEISCSKLVRFLL